MFSIVTGLQKTACDIVTTVITEEYLRDHGTVLFAYLGFGPDLHIRSCCTGLPPQTLGFPMSRMVASPHDEMAGKETVAYRRGRMCEVARFYDSLLS